jgi:hypothetical protein
MRNTRRRRRRWSVRRPNIRRRWSLEDMENTLDDLTEKYDVGLKIWMRNSNKTTY